MSAKKALIVDNDKVIVDVLSDILEQEGHAVDKAYGGLEALHILKNASYDIVFLDLVMPRVGGDRICRYIQQSPHLSTTKVVIVSAVAVEAQHKILQLKPDACIAKAAVPIMRNNIQNALQSIYAQSDAPSGEIILGKEGVRPRSVVQELLFAQRHFEAILNSMSEAVIELDTDGIITYVNPPAQELLQKPEWDLIGRNFFEGFLPDYKPAVEAILQELLSARESIARELTITYGEHEYLLSFRSVIRDDVLIGTSVVANDMTEKRLLEKERYLRERLGGVIEMAGAAAHELNQPLAVIAGHAELLMHDNDALTDKQRRRLKTISEQVERLGNLTRRFTNIVDYKTKDFGGNVKIVDIEKSSRVMDDTKLKGFWE